jgi:hypothetical protein
MVGQELGGDAERSHVGSFALKVCGGLREGGEPAATGGKGPVSGVLNCGGEHVVELGAALSG